MNTCFLSVQCFEDKILFSHTWCSERRERPEATALDEQEHSEWTVELKGFKEGTQRTPNK